MATEADVPESISVTTEAGDGCVSTGKFDITVDQCSPVELKKSEGEEDRHPEPVKCFVEGDVAHVESKNGVSECGNPLEPLSDPKVGKQETCVAESFQVDESNQAETGIPDRENGEKGSEEKEAVEATEEKAEQHVESNGIVNAEAAEASRSKTNIDEHVQVISDQQDSVDEIPLEKSFAMVYEEKGPQVTLETKESAEDKLESASVLDDHEENAGLGKEIQEKSSPDTPLLTQTEDIIEESPKEVKNQYETFEETPEASGAASEAVKEDENAECQVESPCMKHEEDTLKKGEALDIGEDSVAKEKDTEGFSAVEHIKTNSTDREGEGETNLKDFLLARSNLNSVEDEAAASRESSETITTAEDERQVVNLEQNREEEGKAEKANTSSDTIEDETPDEQNLPAASILMPIVTESEIADVGESTISEPNENVERSEEVLNVSTVKCDERDQGDGTNPTKDDKDVDTFTAKVTEDDDYTSPVTIAETSAKATPNDEESSPQTMQKCDSGEELQHLRDVMPEETKTETSRESAEGITCTKEETTTQSTQESLDEEKKEATENTNNLEDDNARDEVLEAAGTEQETGEHVVREIHTVAVPPQDFVDKETNEETSTEYQACTEAADLSINTEEKNLREQAISELSSPLVVEETTKEIPKDEETNVLILKEEKKEEDAECDEPADVKSMTREALPETTENITEPNKDLNDPISEESNKTFVENISSLAEVSETETEKHIQEKDGLAVSNSDSVSGEVSHVTSLKEVETENEEQKENIDTAPEEKGQGTVLRDETASEVEDIGVQAEENCESKEKLEEYIPTAADEGETLSKEVKAEKEEQKKYCDIAAEEKGANILTDETPLEDSTDVQAEKNVEPMENLEEQIPIRADESEIFLKEAEAESKDEKQNTDVSREDIDGQGEGVVNSEENLDKQIPTGDRETNLKEAEAEKEEQGKSTDIVPEEKGTATILTDEKSLDVEDTEVKTRDSVETKESVEEQIPIAADEDGKSNYISLEDIDVQAEENLITRENLENPPILTTSDEQETGSEETEAEIKAQVKSIDIVPEEKGLETISTAETPLVLKDTDVKAEESSKSKENVEEQTPTAADEGEKSLKKAKAETKEQIDEENLNPQESSDKEEVTEITNTKEDDTEREEVLETTSTEQETGEHVVYEIHTVAKPPEDSIDKETNEENSAEHQACTEAADLSTTAEEKNLEEHAIQELSSPLVVEEATNEIPKEEETYTTLSTLLEEEEKEGHATCNEATEEYAAEIEKNIQEKDGATLSNSESVSGELSHVALKESETKIEMQDKDIDTVPEERGQATILADETASEVEDIDVKLKENFESKENLEEQFPIGADEGEIFSKEAEAENKEQAKHADTAHEDVDVQADKTVNSGESIDKQILPMADEGETSLKEAEAEIKEQVTYTDIVPEEKGLATILKNETALEAEDIDVQAEESFESKEKFEDQNPIAADEDETFLKEADSENKEQIKHRDIAPEDKGLATILTDEKASNIEDIGLQAEETFNSCKNLESKIPSTADEHEISLEEAEAVNMEQVKCTDIVPEEKGLANIITDETSLDVEDIDVKVDENEPKETVGEQIPTATHDGGTFLNEAESENKEHTENTDTSPEEKGLATISTDKATLDVEDIGVQAERSLKSKEDFEEKIPTAANEDETFLKEAEAETKEHIKCCDISPEEKGITNISTDEATLDVEDIGVQAERSFKSKEDFEEKIPTAVDEDETFLKEAEAETKEHIKCCDISPEETGLTNISTDETSLDVKDTEVKAEESFESNENLEEQITTAAGKGETRLREAEAETDDQVKNDIAPEEKVQETISKEEMALAIDDACAQAEANSNTKEFSDKHIPTAGDEDEEKIAHANVVLNDTPGVQILEEAEPKVGVEEESCKSEDQPEKTNAIVEEVFDESKITGRDFNKEEIIEGNVACFTQESIEEDTVNKSLENENANKILKEEGSCIESLKEGNGDDLSLEYIREDESEMFKDGKKDPVKYGGEIFKESQTDGVDESITRETHTIAERSEEIVSTSPVKYEEGKQGESSGPASREKDSNEDTFSIKVAEEGDRAGAVADIETSANVNGEEGLPQAVPKSEPVEGHEKLLDVMPEENQAESTSENAEVLTCTKEEIKIQNIQESSGEEKKEETTPMNYTKENETEVEEVFESASTEQETGEQATREIHTIEDNAQEFNDKETTEENLNEYQVSSEAADSSTVIVGKNSDEQASRELSSSLVGEDTNNESSKQEENYVSSLKEEENEVNVECKEPVEVAKTTHETKFETLEDGIEPKEDLYAHISEEETHTEESSKVVNSLQSEVSEKDGCTDLEGAEAETKEQVKYIEIDHEEKGLTIILTDGAALENVNSEEFPDNQIPTVADEGECNTELAGDKAAEENPVQRLEEAEPKLRVEDESRKSEDHPENKNMIVEEPQLLEQVLDEPKSTDGDFSEGQTTEGNAAICAPEIIQEETAKNSQDSDKESENLEKEGSGIESVKAYNTNDLSQEFTPEDGSKKFDDNKQDTVKFEGEILKEPEIDGVGESTTYETNQIVETSEEILDASPVKYEEGQPGEGSSQDSAKASKEEDVSEVDDSNGAVTVTESSAVVTSKGEDSAEASEKYEPEEEKVPVKISDVADVKEVCDLEDKASFAEKTTEETSLQKEGHAEVSELAPEKLHGDATEEEFKKGSEIVPESDSRSIDVVSKDEIVTSQTLDKGILQEQVEVPSCTLLTEETEIEASQHEHETPTKDNNIEEEPEKEVPADGNVGDLFAVRSEDKTPLQKEESKELKASELVLEKLDAGDTEKEIKETFMTISISDSQSTDALSKDEIVADQTHLEASYALLPKEEELRTYQDDRETTTQDKSIEEEYAKETDVPADENGRDLLAATLAEETLLQKEEPRELKVSELAPKNLDTGETEEIKEPFEKVSKSDSQSAEVVSGDETTANQTLSEGISNEELQLPSSTLLAEEKEMKISQCVHETTTQDKNKEDESTEKNEVPDGNTRGIFVAATSEEETRLQMEEPREFKACELAPEKLDAGETEEEIKETLETIPKSDSQSIDTVSKDDIVADQTLVGSSYTSLPEEKEHQAGESEVPAAENGGDLISARSVEETILKKEEPGELKVSELAPEELNAGETEEEIKKTPETVSEPDTPSTDVVSRDEVISDRTLREGISTEKLQIPSSILLPEEKEIKASEEHRTTFCDKNIEENASNLQMQVDENVKATSMEEETSLIKEEPRQLKASDFELQLKAEVPRKSSNEEIKEDEKLPEESEPYSVREESHDENKAKAEKQGEQIDETSTIKTNEHQNELSEVDEKGIASDKYERQLTFEGLSIKENDPRYKTTHDGFTEEEKRFEEAVFEFGLKNQGDEINSKSSITSTQMEKDSSTEVSCKAPIVETSQGIESNECGKVISTESGTVSLPNLVPESTKETATVCKELKTEEDEEEEHENSEQLKPDEEKENEHKNQEAGYESPIMVEASRDADVNVKVVSHKKSNNILSGIKHSMSKVKKAIIGKSSHPKTHSEK